MSVSALSPVGGYRAAFRVGLTALVALAMLVAAGLAARGYPLGWAWPLALLTGYALLLWRWPGCWLAILPTVLLAIDQAPWTGWLLYDESDLTLAVTVAIGYLRLSRTPPIRRLTPPAVPILTLLVAAFLVSLARGLLPLPAPDLNALTDYSSNYNSLRVAKGMLWALLLLPLLRRTLDDDGVRRYLLPGLLSALAAVAAIVLWERLTFTGLLDFASDYRATGPFSAMHTGGAVLDGALALLMPFSLLWLLQAKRPLSVVAALLLTGLGVYAVMATFSRGLYLGFGLTLAMIGLGLLLGRRQSRRLTWRFPLILFLLLLTGSLLLQVFTTGGYRTLAATLILLFGALFVGALPSALPKPVHLIVGLAMGLASEGLLWLLFAKGAYLAFGLAALLWIGGVLALAAERRPAGALAVIVGCVGMAVGVGLVAWGWGGEPALIGALPAISLALGLAALNLRFSLWRWERSTWLGAGLVAVILGIGIPITGSYYVGERLSQAPRDWGDRLQHWRASLAMMDADWATTLWGMGIGRFPTTYFWRNPIGELPGNFRYEAEGGNLFLRLSGALHPRGYGEALRVSQRVQPQLHAAYTLSLDARASGKPAVLEAALCQKWLLYGFDCSARTLKISDRDWRHFDLPLDTLSFASDFWGSRRGAQLVLSNDVGGATLDVDNLRLRDNATGAELLRNGDFARGGDRWFFTSDRHHLPWHAKNLWLNVLFDQGWIGVALLGWLMLLGLVRTLLQVRRGNRLALGLLAALSAFLVVGLFDSLLDAPRLALLFYLLLFIALFDESGTQDGIFWH